jgi:hypothetical protein
MPKFRPTRYAINGNAINGTTECSEIRRLFPLLADAVVENLLQLLTAAPGTNAKCRHVRYVVAIEG